MTPVRLFRVGDEGAAAVQPVTLSAAGLRERTHLQEWVIQHPEVLGDDLLVLTSEFDRWEASDGATARDRLDVLALEPSGRLVVAELKREEDRRIHIQAITYAALVSSFTPETLADVYAAFMSRRGSPMTVTEARTRLDEHVVEGWDEDLLRRPRIVLVAGAYPRTVTHSAVWLSELGLDITLMQVSAWRSGAEVFVGFDCLYPTPEVSDFTLAPARAEARAVSERAEQRGRAAAAPRRLFDAGVLQEGTPLALVPSHGVTESERQAIEDWVREDPKRGRATWHQAPLRCLRWEGDGELWRPTPLARHILATVTGRTDAAIRGTAWWVTEAGTDLAELADSLGDGGSGHRGFDWSRLHRILNGLPAGRWTTYGDLAQVIGTDAQPVGNHILHCTECIHGERVLKWNGRLASNFRWTEPDRTDDPRALLLAEGITFDESGRADAGRRLSKEELSRLADDSEDG